MVAFTGGNEQGSVPCNCSREQKGRHCTGCRNHWQDSERSCGKEIAIRADRCDPKVQLKRPESPPPGVRKPRSIRQHPSGIAGTLDWQPHRSNHFVRHSKQQHSTCRAGNLQFHGNREGTGRPENRTPRSPDEPGPIQVLPIERGSAVLFTFQKKADRLRQVLSIYESKSSSPVDASDPGERLLRRTHQDFAVIGDCFNDF